MRILFRSATRKVSGMSMRIKQFFIGKTGICLLIFTACFTLMTLSGPHEPYGVKDTLSGPVIQPWVRFETCCHYVYEPVTDRLRQDDTRTNAGTTTKSVFLPEFNNPCYLYKDEHKVLDRLFTSRQNSDEPARSVGNTVKYKDAVDGTIKHDRLRCLPQYFVLGEKYFTFINTLEGLILQLHVHIISYTFSTRSHGHVHLLRHDIHVHVRRRTCIQVGQKAVRRTSTKRWWHIRTFYVTQRSQCGSTRSGKSLTKRPVLIGYVCSTGFHEHYKCKRK